MVLTVLGILIVGILCLALVGWGIFWFLIQAGVVVQKAIEPPTTDSHDYRLEQGHEVRGEDQSVNKGER